MTKKQNSEFLIVKNGIFSNSEISKVDFTENRNDRKILKFQHCDMFDLEIFIYVKHTVFKSGHCYTRVRISRTLGDNQ